jgi:hypothetical protein
MESTTALQASERLRQILNNEARAISSLAEIEPLLEVIRDRLPLLRIWAATPGVRQSKEMERCTITEVLASELDDELSLEHHIQLVDFYSNGCHDLPGPVAEALTAYQAELETAEESRLKLWRLIHSQDQQVAEE